MAPDLLKSETPYFVCKSAEKAALPFISGQTTMDTDWVGIDNRAAGATAAALLGRFCVNTPGTILVIAESMQSRDSLDRRLGFDAELNERFPNLKHFHRLRPMATKNAPRRLLPTLSARTQKLLVYM